MMTHDEAVIWLCLQGKYENQKLVDLDDISPLIQAIPEALDLGRAENVVPAVDFVAERLGYALVVAEKWTASEQWADTLLELTGARGLMHIMSGIDSLALSYYPGRDLKRVARVMVRHAKDQEIEPFSLEPFEVDYGRPMTQMPTPHELARMRLAALQGVAIPTSTTNPAVTALTFAQIIGWDDEAVHAAADRDGHERYYRYRMYVPNAIIEVFTQDETLDAFAKIVKHTRSWTPQHVSASAYIHFAVEQAGEKCLEHALSKVGEVRSRDEYRGIVGELIADLGMQPKNFNPRKSIRVAARVIPEMRQMLIDGATDSGIALEMLECLEGDDEE